MSTPSVGGSRRVSFMSGSVASWLKPPPGHRGTAEGPYRVERAGDPFVVYFDDEERQRIVTLLLRKPTRLAIGHSADAAICLSWDSQVSRVHAELERVGEHWVLAGEGLSNGTYLNELRITGRRLLADKDVVRVGPAIDPLPRAEYARMRRRRSATAPRSPPSPRRRRVLMLTADVAARATPATNPPRCWSVSSPSPCGRRTCIRCSTRDRGAAATTGSSRSPSPRRPADRDLNEPGVGRGGSPGASARRWIAGDSSTTPSTTPDSWPFPPSVPLQALAVAAPRLCAACQRCGRQAVRGGPSHRP